mmetsp:Transcript_9222/g.20576  ORF Transcript_9222/g.20576 Transcript_9222/m.20576 type:complete len:914 (+) Transcript_9222:123-2864(+)|eukprot:CAMPEP_0178422564 /NCGR_PEP_ID=MMETSP0689_2-20121128/27240_1 /TAXON_ID=160604 /ORGANISM="Amphidinium massartii, Strain CS-259" /LENGTH=913 /DNA_ID=CAMNT_0020044135 /DNA_START=62 /DNA_END=2803 /DNA_ORIENTATION=+
MVQSPWIIDLATAVTLVPPGNPEGLHEEIGSNLWKCLQKEERPPRWVLSKLAAQEIACAPAGYIVADELLHRGMPAANVRGETPSSRSTSSRRAPVRRASPSTSTQSRSRRASSVGACRCNQGSGHSHGDVHPASLRVETPGRPQPVNRSMPSPGGAVNAQERPLDIDPSAIYECYASEATQATCSDNDESMPIGQEANLEQRCPEANAWEDVDLLLDKIEQLLPQPYIPSAPSRSPRIPDVESQKPAGSGGRRVIRIASSGRSDVSSAVGTPRLIVGDMDPTSRRVSNATSRASSRRSTVAALSPMAGVSRPDSMHLKKKGSIKKDSADSRGASLLQEIKAAPLLRQLNKRLPAGARVCVLGSRCLDREQETVILAVAQSLSELESPFCILTTGSIGAQRCFAEAFADASRVFNLLSGRQSSGFDRGVDVPLADEAHIFRKLVRKTAQIYLLFGGGAGAEKEAATAQKAGALVLPFRRMGGAAASTSIKRPQYIQDDQWQCINESSDPEEIAQVVAAVIEVFVSKATQSLQPVERDEMEEEEAAGLREVDDALDPDLWVAYRLSPSGPLVLVEDLKRSVAAGDVERLTEALQKVEAQGKGFVDSLAVYPGADGRDVVTWAKDRLRELRNIEIRLQAALQAARGTIEASDALGSSGAWGNPSTNIQSSRRKSEAVRRVNTPLSPTGEPENVATKAKGGRLRRTILQLRDVGCLQELGHRKSGRINELAARATFANSQAQLEQAEQHLQHLLHEAKTYQGLCGPVYEEAQKMFSRTLKHAKVDLFERYVRSVSGVFEALKEALRSDSRIQLEVALARCRLEVGACSLIGEEALELAEAAGLGAADSADPWKSLSISSHPWEVVFRSATKRWVQLRDVERIIVGEASKPSTPFGSDFMRHLMAPVVSSHPFPDSP